MYIDIYIYKYIYIEESQKDHSSLSPPLQEGAFGTNLGQGFVHLAGRSSLVFQVLVEPIVEPISTFSSCGF